MPEHEEIANVPPSTDVVEFTVVNGEKVHLFCLICQEIVGEDVDYLNQAIIVWRNHVEEKKAEAD